MVRCCSSLAFIFVTAVVIQAAAAAPAPAPVIKIRIHDYANVQAAALARAQRIVARTYQAIGVRIEWLGATRPLEDLTAAAPCGQTDLTVIVLSSEMASHHSIPADVVGYAAVTHGEAGRIAFVIYDRVLDVARHADADVTRVLGTVMAHELGHLLLPAGAHSEAGLMRAHWAATDFRHLDAGDLRLSSSQAERIRQTINDAAPLPTQAEAAPAGADTDVGLLTTTVDD